MLFLAATSARGQHAFDVVSFGFFDTLQFGSVERSLDFLAGVVLQSVDERTLAG